MAGTDSANKTKANALAPAPSKAASEARRHLPASNKARSAAGKITHSDSTRHNIPTRVAPKGTTMKPTHKAAIVANPTSLPSAKWAWPSIDLRLRLTERPPATKSSCVARYGASTRIVKADNHLGSAQVRACRRPLADQTQLIALRARPVNRLQPALTLLSGRNRRPLPTETTCRATHYSEATMAPACHVVAMEPLVGTSQRRARCSRSRERVATGDRVVVSI